MVGVETVNPFTMRTLPLSSDCWYHILKGVNANIGVLILNSVNAKIGGFGVKIFELQRARAIF